MHVYVGIINYFHLNCSLPFGPNNCTYTCLPDRVVYRLNFACYLIALHTNPERLHRLYTIGRIKYKVCSLITFSAIHIRKNTVLIYYPRYNYLLI